MPSLIRPFTALRPVTGKASAVAAPPYDVMSGDEARQMAESREHSFLHVSRAEIDLPIGTDPYADVVYVKARENLDRLLSEGVLKRDERACYYAYRLTMGEHVQTGLVAVASAEAYDAGRIKKHELTRPQKENDRVYQIKALNAQTGPVFLSYRANTGVDARLERICSQPAAVNIQTVDGVRHEIRVIDQDADIRILTDAFNTMDALYVADGHHRSAAASRVAASRRAANPGHTGEENYNYFLAVLFPHDQMQILAYNRVVKDLNGFEPRAFLERIAEDFELEASTTPLKPVQTGEFGLYLTGRWYRLRLAEDQFPSDPVARLDVSLLSDRLLAPVLGIHDQRKDERIDFVGGIRGLKELERRVNSGEMAAAFSFYPTSMEALMMVADVGQIMPPKSTWFEPKLADGLASHVLD